MWSQEALLLIAGAACTLISARKPPAGLKPAGGYGSLLLDGGGPTRVVSPNGLLIVCFWLAEIRLVTHAIWMITRKGRKIHFHPFYRNQHTIIQIVLLTPLDHNPLPKKDDHSPHGPWLIAASLGPRTRQPRTRHLHRNHRV